MMTRLPIIRTTMAPLAFSIALGMAGLAASPLAAAADTTASGALRGEVVEVFGSKVVVRDPSGARSLVDLGEGAQVPRMGESITVDARQVNGTSQPAASAPIQGVQGTAVRGGRGGDTSAALDAVRRAGYSQARIDEVKRRYVEIDAVDASGQWWELDVDFDGTILKRKRQNPPLSVDEAALTRSLAQAGYRFERVADVDDDEIEVIAINDRNERVKLELDANGRIREEKWLRR